MGYVQLAAPVTHVWYLKSLPSYIAILLDIPLKDVEQIVYLIHMLLHVQVIVQV